jgi:glycosyltransferase involved in cell wall biosynthesis
VSLLITDAGSTDGTVEYLQQLSASDPRVTAILLGKKIGQARALNQVFPRVNTEFVGWLSDDNEVVNGGLDTAVDILQSQPRIGMVGLKVKDVVGPRRHLHYIGAISRYGVLNVNQGVLRTSLMHELGGFCEEYPDYCIDVDLTTRVLLKGWTVVFTRDVAIHHYREWAASPDSPEVQRRGQLLQVAKAIYRRKFADCNGRTWPALSIKYHLYLPVKVAARIIGCDSVSGTFLGHNWRDLKNVFQGRYIALWDCFRCWRQPFHLAQRPERRCKRGLLGAQQTDISASAREQLRACGASVNCHQGG